MAGNGQFQPGHSGGPGRPKQKPLLDWCRKWTLERCESVLGPIAENPKHKQQLEAIKTILAYGIGKPVESVETSHQFDGLGIDPGEAKEFLGQLIERAAPGGVNAGGGSGAGKEPDPPALLDPEREAGGSNP